MVEKFATQVETDGFHGYILDNGERLNEFAGKFDVIMVDLEASNPTIVMTAPSAEILQKSMLLTIRKLLGINGVLILNVLRSRWRSHRQLITLVTEVFTELYEIFLETEEYSLLIAAASEIDFWNVSHSESEFLKKLKQVAGSLPDAVAPVVNNIWA